MLLDSSHRRHQATAVKPTPPLHFPGRPSPTVPFGRGVAKLCENSVSQVDRVLKMDLAAGRLLLLECWPCFRKLSICVGTYLLLKMQPFVVLLLRKLMQHAILSRRQVQRCCRTARRHDVRPGQNQPAAGSASVRAQGAQICVRENQGVFRLLHQI